MRMGRVCAGSLDNAEALCLARSTRSMRVRDPVRGERGERNFKLPIFLRGTSLGNLLRQLTNTTTYSDISSSQKSMSASAIVLAPSSPTTPASYHRIISPTLRIPTDISKPIPVGLLACQRASLSPSFPSSQKPFFQPPVSLILFSSPFPSNRIYGPRFPITTSSPPQYSLHITDLRPFHL